jgi:hypothetical protein
MFEWYSIAYNSIYCGGHSIWRVTNVFLFPINKGKNRSRLYDSARFLRMTSFLQNRSLLSSCGTYPLIHLYKRRDTLVPSLDVTWQFLIEKMYLSSDPSYHSKMPVPFSVEFKPFVSIFVLKWCYFGGIIFMYGLFNDPFGAKICLLLSGPFPIGYDQPPNPRHKEANFVSPSHWSWR